MSGSPFLSFLGQAVVVGIGWFVVHKHSAARDRDKARREMVAKSADTLADSVNVIFADARTYHSDTRDVAVELRLKMAIQHLAMRVQGLSDICNEEKVLAPCRVAVSALRKSITGSHFEDEHTGPLSEADRQFQLIAEAALRASRTLLTLKHSQFPIK